MAADEAKSEVEVMKSSLDEGGASNYYLAQVSNYTDRPDLLIAEIEKNDPGFIKRMNEAAEKDAEEARKSRFYFGKWQAYTGLFVAALAAVAILAIMAIAVLRDQGFWTIIALGLVYAITQGGSHGFSRLIEGIHRMLPGKTKDRGEDK